LSAGVGEGLSKLKVIALRCLHWVIACARERLNEISMSHQSLRRFEAISTSASVGGKAWGHLRSSASARGTLEELGFQCLSSFGFSDCAGEGLRKLRFRAEAGKLEEMCIQCWCQGRFANIQIQ